MVRKVFTKASASKLKRNAPRNIHKPKANTTPTEAASVGVNQPISKPPITKTTSNIISIIFAKPSILLRQLTRTLGGPSLGLREQRIPIANI